MGRKKHFDLSVVIPCYNCTKHIDNLLDSIIAQETTYTYEIVCACDSCTDGTEDYIKDKLTKAKVAHTVFSVTNHNTGLSRQDGMGKAIGDYIWFMDDDDNLLTTEAFQSAIDCAKETKMPIIRVLYHNDYMPEWNPWVIWQYIYKRDFIKDFNFPNIKISDDVEFTKQVYGRMGEKVSVNNTKAFPVVEKEFYNYIYPRKGSQLDEYYKEKGMFEEHRKKAMELNEY